MAEIDTVEGFVIPPPRPNTSPPVLRAPRAVRGAVAAKEEENGTIMDEGAAADKNPEPAATESKEDQKRHYQSYHDHYYSITPRDPRLSVPLRPICPDPTKTNTPADAALPLTGMPKLMKSPQQAALDVGAKTPQSISFGGPPKRQHTPPPQQGEVSMGSGNYGDRAAIASAGNNRGSSTPSDSKPIRSPGTTHQPYATTPMTPDCLPSNLLQSPANFSLEGHANNSQTSFGSAMDPFGRNRSPANNGNTIFAAPVIATGHYNMHQQQPEPLPATGQWRSGGQPGNQMQQQQQQPNGSPLTPGSSGSNNQQQQQQGGGRGRGGNSNGGKNSMNNSTTQPQSSIPKSALLQKFHSDESPQRNNLTMLELTNHMTEFSMDQDGSRLIQRLMVDEGTSASVLAEVLPSAADLMVDVFGNYVIQRLLETGNQMHRTALLGAMQGHVVSLSLQTYGCRVVQKALHYSTTEEQRIIANELQGHVAECVRDQNGNHVIQKCIEMMPSQAQFLTDAFLGNLPGLASHAYGCRVMQRLFERCPNTDASLERVVMETLQYTDQLVNDQYGNYVIQHILINGTVEWRKAVLDQLKTRFAKLSCSKFSSNVTEKLFVHSNDASRLAITEHLINERDANGCCSFVYMMQDQFANYVVQKIIDLSSQPVKERIIGSIVQWVPEIRRFTYGKHIVARLEKMSLLPPGSGGPDVGGPPLEDVRRGGGGRGGRGEGRGRGGRGGRGGDRSNNQQNHQPQQQQFQQFQQLQQMQGVPQQQAMFQPQMSMGMQGMAGFPAAQQMFQPQQQQMPQQQGYMPSAFSQAGPAPQQQIVQAPQSADYIQQIQQSQQPAQAIGQFPPAGQPFNPQQQQQQQQQFQQPMQMQQPQQQMQHQQAPQPIQPQQFR